MLKRHEVEILLKAHHSKAEVARLAGVSLRSVKLSLAKMLSGANAFRISDHQLNPRQPEDKMNNVTCPAASEK